MIVRNLNFKYFIMAFAFGILIVYVTAPPPLIVVKFPSPVNADKLVYRASNDECYKFQAEKKECPLDTTKVKVQPAFELD